jgi:hypothetical protein
MVILGCNGGGVLRKGQSGFAGCKSDWELCFGEIDAPLTLLQVMCFRF